MYHYVENHRLSESFFAADSDIGGGGVGVVQNFPAYFFTYNFI
jgi:hypothetical protein